MMTEDKAEPQSSGADRLISEFSSQSLYSSPLAAHDSTAAWITPGRTVTCCINGTVFETSPVDLSMPAISRQLALSTAAADAFDEELLFPVQLVPRILCVGMACMDVTLSVDTYPIENQKMRTTQSILSGGGNAANTGGRLQY